LGWDGDLYKFDLGQAETEIFLQTGLDRVNQIDLLQQITGLLTSRLVEERVRDLYTKLCLMDALHISCLTSRVRFRPKGARIDAIPRGMYSACLRVRFLFSNHGLMTR
jgi:hypothetical protein